MRVSQGAESNRQQGREQIHVRGAHEYIRSEGHKFLRRVVQQEFLKERKICEKIHRFLQEDQSQLPRNKGHVPSVQPVLLCRLHIQAVNRDGRVLQVSPEVRAGFHDGVGRPTRRRLRAQRPQIHRRRLQQELEGALREINEIFEEEFHHGHPAFFPGCAQRRLLQVRLRLGLDEPTLLQHRDLRRKQATIEGRLGHKFLRPDFPKDVPTLEEGRTLLPEHTGRSLRECGTEGVGETAREDSAAKVKEDCDGVIS